MAGGGRYSRLSRGTDIENDAIDFILNGGANSGRNGYVALDDLDEEGRQSQSRGFVKDDFRRKRTLRRAPNTLIYLVFVLIAVIVIGAAVSSPKRRNRFGLRPKPNYPLYNLSNGTHTMNASTILISLDGFHPHYVSDKRTPRLHQLVEDEAAVPYMIPSFPTQTFPNHWTLVTGLEPIHHGIVGNYFLDPELGQFENSDPALSSDPDFWGGEPLWVTARKQGRRAGVHMWPGSEIDWALGSPDYISKYNGTETLPKKADAVLEWLDDPKLKPELMLAYVPTVDIAGHKSGITGPLVLSAIKQVDDFVGSILDGISSRNMSHIVNVVIVSDHGMAPTSDKRIITLDDWIPVDKVVSREGWPLAGLTFEEGTDIKEITDFLEEAGPEGFKWYMAEDLPREWNFRPTGKYANRMAPFYLIPDLGWAFVTRKEWRDMGGSYDLGGVHGYDNREPLMRAFFVAKGPAFPAGHYNAIRSIDVYSGICDSLGLTPAPNDGNFGLRPLRKPIHEEYPSAPYGVDTLPLSTFDIFEPHMPDFEEKEPELDEDDDEKDTDKVPSSKPTPPKSKTPSPDPEDGDDDEEEGDDEDYNAPSKKLPPKVPSKSPPKSKLPSEDEDGEEDDDDEDYKAPPKVPSKSPPNSKRPLEEDDGEEEDDDEDYKAPPKKTPPKVPAKSPPKSKHPPKDEDDEDENNGLDDDDEDY